jgi:exodeoxyribonuclease V beta subunit
MKTSPGMKINTFDPVQTKLLKGINLIEASAGTGKTYAIAMLVLRFVVEQGIAIEKLLVVTFTKAATEELKDRVRCRLTEAKRALDGNTDDIDGNIIDWLANLDVELELVKQRLQMALLDIDCAGIFTIHGFCQRVLREHALESGQLFDAELTSELADIKQACTDDFWRKQIYQRPAWEIEVLTRSFHTPDALLASIASFPINGCHTKVYPVCGGLDEALKELQQQMALAKLSAGAHANTLRHCFADGKFKTGYSDTFDYQYDALSAWLHGGTTCVPDIEAFALFTKDGLMEALHGNKFRANKNQTSEQGKAEYLAELSIDTSPFDALAMAFKQTALVFRKALLDHLREGLDKHLLKLNVFSFDDLISRLAEALQSEKGELLTTELQQRFEVALIDEFQDTDDSQWFIFSSLFAVPSHFLYLIGDPKQAIYKFRGADIYSYLNAQKQAEHRFTLGHNWRSHPQLVDAVNVLFQRDRAFFLDDLQFLNVKPGLSSDNGELHHAGHVVEPMVLWQLPETESKTGYWTAGKAGEEIRIAVANEVIELLNGDYTLQPMNRHLRPKDIAILVRNNSQARDYQAALRLVGVPSVLNSTESVFASQEAADLYSLLQAVAHPGESALLKQALMLDWFDLDGQTLYQLSNNETELDAWTSRFLDYFQNWQQSGLMAMMQHLLRQEKIRAGISKTLMAERQLTNLYHLIELVQQAAVDEHLGINKTLDWLGNAIVKASSADDQQLRLESDDDAVKIVTMHRSKGLEYSIAFCPYLWQRNDRLLSEQSIIRCHENGQTIVDLGSGDFERYREMALNEELAEDLRVFYVAVTRAKYRCYIAWGDVRTQDKVNSSAMAWLLKFADADFSTQQARLQAFQNDADKCFAYRLLPVPSEVNGSYQKSVADSQLQTKKRKRSLYTTWQMSSYTGLSALSLHDAPELPEDKAGEQTLVAKSEPGSAVMELPRGAHTGNVVHDLLENNAFIDLAQRKNITLQRDKACQRYGLKLERPEMLDELLQAVVATPLSTTNIDFCLMNLAELQCLKEMPFYLSMQAMDAGQINKVLQDTSAFQPLTAKQMCGYLTGFIDLICAFPDAGADRYYVMDYKTNSLPDYSPDSLTQAMREHNYGLQYWIYTVVLHRYLQKRLPDYDYETHFGGVRYLFVRGMRPDQPMSGVYEDRPDLEQVETLAALFGGSQ